MSERDTVLVRDAGQAAYMESCGLALSRKTKSGYLFEATIDEARRALVDYASSSHSKLDGHVMVLKKLAEFPGKSGRGDSVLVKGTGRAAYLAMLGFKLEGASKEGGFWFLAGSPEESADIGRIAAEYSDTPFKAFRDVVEKMRGLPLGIVNSTSGQNPRRS